MFGRQRFAVTAVAVAAAVVLLAACGGGEGSEPEPAPSGGTTTQASITAPPTLTPEEQAEADIQATFEDLIAALDDFKANASDYGNADGSTWNADLVATWPVEAQANVELTNWLAAWRNSEIEQRGVADIRTHTVTDLGLDANGAQVHSANSVACLDMTSLEFVGYDGGGPELAFEPDRYQSWTMTWLHSDQPGGTGNWNLGTIELSRNAPC